MKRLGELPAYVRLGLDVARAEGCELVLKDGRYILDLYGGHCVNALGAGDPALLEELADQWRTLSFQTNLLDTSARHAFLEAFEPNLPPGDWRVFCSNSGAEANENALKLAVAATGRAKVLCFEGAFHGRTAAAAAVSDGSNKALRGAPFEVLRVPWGRSDAVDASVGAVICEPIQSLAGVLDPPAGFLEDLRARCDQHGTSLIFDEVQTGNGRLGTFWAAQHFGVVPDVFSTAKGAGGGFPIGLTISRTDLTARVPGGHFGSTFGGGPLALRAAAHVARRLAEPGFLDNVRAASVALMNVAEHGPVARVRGAGLLLGYELEPGWSAKAVRDALLAHDVLVGTCDDPRVLRLSPPLVLPPAAAERLGAALASLEVRA